MPSAWAQASAFCRELAEWRLASKPTDLQPTESNHDRILQKGAARQQALAMLHGQITHDVANPVASCMEINQSMAKYTKTT